MLSLNWADFLLWVSGCFLLQNWWFIHYLKSGVWSWRVWKWIRTLLLPDWVTVKNSLNLLVLQFFPNTNVDKIITPSSYGNKIQYSVWHLVNAIQASLLLMLLLSLLFQPYLTLGRVFNAHNIFLRQRVFPLYMEILCYLPKI